MAANAFDLIIKHIQEDKSELLRALADGSAKDFAEYRELCGRINGFSRAQYRVEEMKARLKIEDE